MELELWNRIFLLKLLWNIDAKSDNLWVHWIYVYYLTHDTMMERVIKASDSGVF